MLRENHLSFKQHKSARAGAPLVAAAASQKQRGTPPHKKGGTPAGGEEGWDENSLLTPLAVRVGSPGRDEGRSYAGFAAPDDES